MNTTLRVYVSMSMSAVAMQLYAVWALPAAIPWDPTLAMPVRAPIAMVWPIPPRARVHRAFFAATMPRAIPPTRPFPS